MAREEIAPASASRAALGLAARLILGSAFIFSGYLKAVSPPEGFAVVIETYQILPFQWADPMSRVLPWIELFLGAFVLTGYWRRKSALGLGAMLCTFIWALASAQLRGIDLGSCGCFGKFFSVKPSIMTFVDLGLLSLAVLVWKDRVGLLSLDRWIEGAPASSQRGSSKGSASKTDKRVAGSL